MNKAPSDDVRQKTFLGATGGETLQIEILQIMSEQCSTSTPTKEWFW